MRAPCAYAEPMREVGRPDAVVAVGLVPAAILTHEAGLG
jgi:hypothetical protein